MTTTARTDDLGLQACECGHTMMEFNKREDTWNCSQCNVQRADHETPYWRIRPVPNTRGSRFALYGEAEFQSTPSSTAEGTEPVPQELKRSNKTSAWAADFRSSLDGLSKQNDGPSQHVNKEPSINDIRAYVMQRSCRAPNQIIAIARFCGVEKEMCLSNSPNGLCDELNLFFTIIDPYVANAGNKSRPWSQWSVANALNDMGVLCADGRPGISNSNVSNTIRKAVFQRGTSCYKPNYQGKNWMAFE